MHSLGRAAPGQGVDELLDAEQDGVPQGSVAALFAEEHDVITRRKPARCAGEVLDVGDQLAPLGGEDVEDVEILGLRFEESRVGIQEVGVGVPRVPSLLTNVGPPLEPDLQIGGLALGHLEPKGLGHVLDTAEYLHLVRSVGQGQGEIRLDIGVGLAANPHVAAHVLSPPGRDVLHVSFRGPVLPLEVSDVHPDRNWLPGGSIRQVNPHSLKLEVLGQAPYQLGGKVSVH
jgi:hypothetical protein